MNLAFETVEYCCVSCFRNTTSENAGFVSRFRSPSVRRNRFSGLKKQGGKYSRINLLPRLLFVEGHMGWSWSIFVATLFVCFFGIILARRSMKDPNLVLYGDSGD